MTHASVDCKCVQARVPEPLATCWALVAIAATGCGSEPEKQEPRCLPDAPSLQCAAAFAPTFENVFEQVLNRTCSTTGVSCHGPSGRNGGLVFGERDNPTDAARAEAHALLLGTAGGRARVAAGDVTCGKLVVRLHSHGEPWGMPPGDPLDETVLCAIRQWIAAGALP